MLSSTSKGWHSIPVQKTFQGKFQNYENCLVSFLREGVDCTPSTFRFHPRVLICTVLGGNKMATSRRKFLQTGSIVALADGLHLKGAGMSIAGEHSLLNFAGA